MTSMPSSIRSEEHTSELQSRQYLVCRLLLEKKKQYTTRRASNRLTRTMGARRPMAPNHGASNRGSRAPRSCSSATTPTSGAFFFNKTATTEIYTLSLHDALPISPAGSGAKHPRGPAPTVRGFKFTLNRRSRSEEHTSELQSRQYLVCRLLLE